MAASTAGSKRDGAKKSTPAKPAAPAAAAGSRPKASAPAVRTAAKKTAAGTSATTTKTARSTRARSTPAATGQPKPTKRSAGTTPARRRTSGRGTGDLPLVETSPVAGVRRELEAIARRAPELARGGLAALAMSLAQAVEFPDSTTAKANCARALTEALKELRAQAPEKPEADGIEDLAKKYSADLPGSAAPSH